MRTPSVAADTNLLRHPTPHRYITVIGALSEGPVVVLPTVDVEFHKHLPIQAGELIDTVANSKGVDDPGKLQAAKEAGGAVGLEWWANERKRNDGIYGHGPDLGRSPRCSVAGCVSTMQLPGDARDHERC